MVKKIFQLNVVLNVGSTGRIMEELGRIAIGKGWESHVAYGRKFNGASASKVYKIGTLFDSLWHVFLTKFFDRHGFGSRVATNRLVKYIKHVNPDVVVLHNIHGYYLNIRILFQFLKSFNKPVFWILYDCWAITGHCSYFDMLNCNGWKTGCLNCPCKVSYPQSFVSNSSNNYKDKQEIFNGVENMNLIVNSQWLKDTLLQSLLRSYPITLINNGVNLEKFDIADGSRIISKYELDGKFIIAGVANIWNERKGFNDFLLLSELLNDDEVIVLDGLSKEQIALLPNNIISIGKAKNMEELAEIYSLANVFFNPTYEDNFPTTNLEALACGTPVITYKTGGSPEAVDRDTGFVCDKGEIKLVYSYAQIIKAAGKAHYQKICRSRAERLYNYKDRYNDYVELFEKHLI